MTNLGFPIYPNIDFPYTGEPTSSFFLQQSLGSFFNQLWTEKGVVRGYTIGEAEELLQAYQDLTETVYSFGVKDITVDHLQIWQPLQIKKSDLNEAPFIFEENGAVFGPQPESDPYYSGKIFQFGFPKSPSQKVFTYTPNFLIDDISLIANRIFNPTNYYITNVDVTLGTDNTLFFNRNPFLDMSNTIIDLIGTNGSPIIYVDQNGITQNDQLLVLWIYNVNIDTQNLYNNFGYIFNINRPTSKDYKNILTGFFNVAVEGTTVKALKSLISYIGNVVPVIEDQETVQYIATTEYNKIVVTDKNSYLFTLDATIKPTVVVGAVFYAGDTFTDLFSYYDNVVKKNWWEQLFINNSKVSISSNLFLGNYKYQFYLQNSLQLITLSNDILNFPILGNADDVAAFESYINETNNKTAITSALGLSSTSPNLPINPLNFIFDNFLKNNTALFVLSFESANQTADFLNLFELVREYLPVHVYVLMLITINNSPDVYDKLNNSITFTAYPGEIFNADGSTSDGNIPSVAPYFYKNAIVRLFSIGKTPLKDGVSLLDSLDSVGCNGVAGNNGTCIDAKVFTNIPAGATTRTVGTLKVIDFS